ncbi:hypothetical protein CR513_36258, partial [Mucuna pruriens]
MEGSHIRTTRMIINNSKVESELRVAYNTGIQTSWENGKSELEQLSTARSEIPGTVIPLTTATSASSRKFFHNGRLDEKNFQQNLTATIHDLKMQVGQLVDSGITTTGHTVAESETSRSRYRIRSRLPISTRRSVTNEDLLKLFRKVDINIPLLDAIKWVPKYVKFLEELCIQRRKKMKGAVETGGIVSTLVKHEATSTRVQ